MSYFLPSMGVVCLGIAFLSMGVAPHWYTVASCRVDMILGDEARGATSYSFQKTSSSNPLPYTFCVLHENEETAADCVQQFLREIGGTLWEVKSTGNRNVSFKLKKKKYSFDPNRIYTPSGISNTLRDFSRQYSDDAFSQVSVFAKKITDSLFYQNNVLVSVHNSSDAKFSIRTYLPDSTLANTAADVYINEANDEDEFFYVTLRSDFQQLKTQGFNVVLQNPDAPDDGSLSIFCGNNKIRYINIEAQHGHRSEQLTMLYAAHSLLDNLPIKPLPSMNPRLLDSTKAPAKIDTIRKRK